MTRSLWPFHASIASRLWRRWMIAVLLVTGLLIGFTAPAGSQEAPTIPAEIRITAIGVIAAVEAIGITGTAMDAPSALHLAGWYDDTARLGEGSNVVMTGYYFWAGMPALFSDLALLTPGDAITVTDQGGAAFIYEVDWVRTFDKETAPLQEIVGVTQVEVLTLITDAGEYDYDRGIYPRSTVVRANLVDIESP